MNTDPQQYMQDIQLQPSTDVFVPPQVPFVAYKIFGNVDGRLVSNGDSFNVGEIYTGQQYNFLPYPIFILEYFYEGPDSFAYCEEPVVCEIEVLGNVRYDGSAGCTDSFRIIRELSHQDWKEAATGTFILPDGSIYRYLNGREHCDEIDPMSGQTLPAVEYSENRTKMWKNDGKLHRTDKDPVSGQTLPAKIWDDGKNSRLEWYENGKLHRTDRDPVSNQLLPADVSAFGLLHFVDGTMQYTN